MAHEDESLTGEFNEKILVLKRRYVKVIMDLIAELQEREGGQVIDLRVATFSLFGMMNWIYTWYQPRRDLPCPSSWNKCCAFTFWESLRAARPKRRGSPRPPRRPRTGFLCGTIKRRPCWSNGKLEYWSNGRLEYWVSNPSFQCSTLPVAMRRLSAVNRRIIFSNR